VKRLLVCLLAFGCTVETPAAEKGGELFRDPAFAGSSFNKVSCATCHQTEAVPEPGRVDPGYNLHGVAAREGFWGGQSQRLVDAVNTCLVYFMRGRPLDEGSDEARQLYEYLLSLTPSDSDGETLPMTIVEDIVPVAQGDETRGAALYQGSCARCHGEAHTGAGGIAEGEDGPIILPEVADSYAEDFPGVAPGLVFVEKIRHGRFFDIGGTMAPYSREALSDEQVGDLLAFFGLPN
jgi:thiosulfate dehydrogenase